MSWDVILIRTTKNTEQMGEINETNTVVFGIAETIRKLKAAFDTIEHVSERWLYYEGGSFEISFNLAVSEQVMLHISIFDEPVDAVETVIHRLCRLFECRAFDTTSGDFIG